MLDCPGIYNGLKIKFQLAQSHADKLRSLFAHYTLPAIELVRGRLKEILTSVDSALLMSFLRLMDFRMSPLSGKDNRPPPPPQFQALVRKLISTVCTYTVPICLFPL